MDPQTTIAICSFLVAVLEPPPPVPKRLRPTGSIRHDSAWPPPPLPAAATAARRGAFTRFFTGNLARIQSRQADRQPRSMKRGLIDTNIMAGMTGRRGQIIVQPGANVWPHESRTAEALAASGRTVEFIRRSEQQRVTSADVIMDGLVWEMKAPKASSLKTVEKNLRKATTQSPCVIFDSHRMKGIPDHAIERELRACAGGRIRALKRLLFVNRQAQVIDIK